MSIAAHIVGTPLVALRQIAAAVILSAFDLWQNLTEKHAKDARFPVVWVIWATAPSARMWCLNFNPDPELHARAQRRTRHKSNKGQFTETSGASTPVTCALSSSSLV